MFKNSSTCPSNLTLRLILTLAAKPILVGPFSHLNLSFSVLILVHSSSSLWRLQVRIGSELIAVTDSDLIVTIHEPNSSTLPSNRFSALIPTQSIAIVSTFTLESGRVLTSVPVGFKTWGKLNEARDNVMIICHALTGSSDVEDW